MKILISLLLVLSISFLSAQAEKGHHHKKHKHSKNKHGHHKKHAHHKKEHRHHKAHEHGMGKLNLVTEGSKLVIEIELPADDIVGFEHRPKTQEQKKSISRAIDFLKKSFANIRLPKAAKCKEKGPGKVETELTQEGHKSDKHQEHSEFHITYTFNCSNVAKLNQIELISFKQFKKMKKLKALGVTESSQFSKMLTSQSPQFQLGN